MKKNNLEETTLPTEEQEADSKNEATFDAETNEADSSVKPEQLKTDFEDKYKRALADYQNLQKQTARERIETIQYANAGLLSDLLPIYNNLKMVVAKTGENNDAWLEGVRLVAKQFKEVITVAGVTEIETNGAFDHNTMEAIGEEGTEDEKLDGNVFKEVMPGYLLNNKLLIPAKVVVYKLKK